MNKKSVAIIVVSVVFACLLGVVIWLAVSNWSAVKSGLNGQKLYTEQEMQEVAKENYEKGEESGLKYKVESETYKSQIENLKKEVLDLKSSIQVKESEILDLNTKIATLQGEIDFVLKFTNNKDTTLIEMTDTLEMLKREISEFGNQKYNEGFSAGLEAGAMSEEELNAILEAEREKAYQEGYERKEYEESMRYYVTYNPNIPAEAVTQIEGEMTFSIHYAGEESSLKINNYSLFGFEFKGWNTSADGTGTNYTNEQVLNLEIPQNINLYAQWDLKEFNITYNLNGGNVSSENPMFVYTITEDFTLVNPTKEGYTFKGWTGTGISTPTTNVVIKQGVTSDLTFTANFEVITYTITYHYGEGSASNRTTYTIETPTFRLNDPQLEGYEFIGWTGTGLSEAIKGIEIEKGSTGDLEFTANYKVATFKVYFEFEEDYYFNGPSMVSVPSSKTVTYGKSYDFEDLFRYTNNIVQGDESSGIVTHVCVGWEIDGIQVTEDQKIEWLFMEDKIARPIWMAV